MQQESFKMPKQKLIKLLHQIYAPNWTKNSEAVLVHKKVSDDFNVKTITTQQTFISSVKYVILSFVVKRFQPRGEVITDLTLLSLPSVTWPHPPAAVGGEHQDTKCKYNPETHLNALY